MKTIDIPQEHKMKTLVKYFLIYMAGFILLFSLHFFLFTEPKPVQNGYRDMSQQQIRLSKRNIISRKFKTAGAKPQSVDQKYEQVASLGSRSGNFESDEKTIRSNVKKHAALIQYERRYGLKGHRNLQMEIGVNPDKFDALVQALKKIGKLTRFQIDKSDKTNEFLDLKAKKISLEKSRNALLELKKREGKIVEMITLENRVLVLEEKIQALGVSLGDFDAENEFSTVKINLNERRLVAKSSFASQFIKSLGWTLLYYNLFWLGLAAFAIVMYVGVWFLRLIIKYLKKLDETPHSVRIVD